VNRAVEQNNEGRHADDAAPLAEVDVLVAGLGPGGCAAALAARGQGLRTLAVEARGPQATRSQLVLVRPGAQAALRRLGLPDITEGRRTTTIRHVENRLRDALVAAVQADAGTGRNASPAVGPALCWHTPVVGLRAAADRVVVTLRDEASGAERRVAARHVIDATGGRLEPLGRPARRQRGPSHVVTTAEYATPPWFDGIVGVRDPATHELYLLFPTWGRRGVIAYFDSPPGSETDADAFAQRFQAIADSLGLGTPLQPPWAVDVFQRALERPSADRVVPIGDAVGTVDALLGAGMSTAIEDGAEAACAIAAAQRETGPERELARTGAVNARLFARHRSTARRGRLLLAVRPILERAWPRATLPAIGRDTPGPPPLLWPAVRFVFGRRPQTS
jgi:flavin-dependent dehydrogenase